MGRSRGIWTVDVTMPPVFGLTLRTANSYRILSATAVLLVALTACSSGDPAPASVIEGWLDGLEGVQAGSRVMLTVPPESGYGSGGNEAVDVGPDETLVYVIDIVDVIPPP